MTDSARFDINAIAASMPPTAETLLLDRYLVDDAHASARVFRVYRGTPPHYHIGSDEFLYVVSGRGTFWIGDETTKADFAPGQLLFFKRNIVHALPDLFEEPVVFLAIDSPRREPTDIHFVDPASGTAQSFIAKDPGPLPLDSAGGKRPQTRST
jgi:mannose-6-phosphate isomerase-like protein (cupin superfamily)